MKQEPSVTTHPSVPQRTSAGRMAFADQLRGLAALWVVLFHLKEGNHIPALVAALPPALVTGLFDWGHLGVAVFFVLSGYVMSLSTANPDIYDARRARTFLLRRLIRLTPPYYFAVAVALILLKAKSAFLHTPAQEMSAAQLFAHFTYLTGILGFDNYNMAFWTLGVEVQFYAAFALMLLVVGALHKLSANQHSKSRRDVVFSVVAVAALAWPAGLIEATGWQASFVGFWYSFMAGALAGQARQEKAWMLPMATIYAICLASIAITNSDPFLWATAATCCCLIIESKLKNKYSGSISTMLQRLGLISYSLYLLHNPITGVCFNILRRTGLEGVRAEFGFSLLTIGLCISAGYYSFRMIEAPAIRRSKSVGQLRSNFLPRQK